MRNILVTGGMGFIGSNFVRYILNTEPEAIVINLDALTYAGNIQNLEAERSNPKHIFIQGDISDTNLVNEIFYGHKIDTVVHFAAESHVDRSIHDPSLFVRTNILGTFTLLEAAKAYWLKNKLPDAPKRFHHISTDEVYGTLEPGEPEFSELTPYAPNSPYAASKAASDHLVRAYTNTYGLPCTISNCSNNYGPFQFPEKLIPLMIINATKGSSLPIYGDGGQVRDWLHVEDHCRAIHSILTSGKIGETYNIGGGNQPTNLEIVKHICRILDEELPNSPWVPHGQLISFVTDRAGHDRRYAVDTRKIQAELGWRPKYTLETGLVSTIQWYLANTKWSDDVSSKAGYQGWIADNYGGRKQ